MSDNIVSPMLESGCCFLRCPYVCMLRLAQAGLIETRYIRPLVGSLASLWSKMDTQI
jgi:hypothetical protein